jgi:hypothetical protein
MHAQRKIARKKEVLLPSPTFFFLLLLLSALLSRLSGIWQQSHIYPVHRKGERKTA